MVLVIDNYDSFTYNLVQMIDDNVKVKRNDEITVEQIKQLNPSHIILSPGPGRPKDAGICKQIVTDCADTPILGVCLGHQAICEAFGGKISYAKQLMHGKSSMIYVNQDNELFNGLSDLILVGRYHSLIGEELPESLSVIATSMEHDEVMAVKHVDYNIYGVQFHPESILTANGAEIIHNFLNISK